MVFGKNLFDFQAVVTEIRTAANNRFALLLGLRLLFCLRGKYAGCYNSIFQRNFVGLFWPVFTAATDAKRQTLTAIVDNDCRQMDVINLIFNLPKRYKIYRLKFVLKKLDPIVSKTFKTSKELDYYRKENIEAYDLAHITFNEIEKLKWEIMTPKQRQKEEETMRLMRLKREGKL